MKEKLYDHGARYGIRGSFKHIHQSMIGEPRAGKKHIHFLQAHCNFIDKRFKSDLNHSSETSTTVVTDSVKASFIIKSVMRSTQISDNCPMEPTLLPPAPAPYIRFLFSGLSKINLASEVNQAVITFRPSYTELQQCRQS